MRLYLNCLFILVTYFELNKGEQKCGMRWQGNHGSGYIVKGLPAYDGRWPWAVQILGSEGHLCGGSILNEYWVLTAAHCIYNLRSPDDITLKIGTAKFNDPKSPEYKPLQWVSHSYYNPEAVSYDIGLIGLKNPLNFDNNIRPICLPTYNLALGYKYCVAIGFGKIDTRRKDPTYLMEGKMNILTKDKCAENLASIGNETKEHYRNAIITNNLLCAGQVPSRDDTNICWGDSGSPLVCLNADGIFVQVGIAEVFEYGRKGEECTNSLFSRIDVHMGFIEEVMKLVPNGSMKSIQFSPVLLNFILFVHGSSSLLLKHIDQINLLNI